MWALTLWATVSSSGRKLQRIRRARSPEAQVEAGRLDIATGQRHRAAVDPAGGDRFAKEPVRQHAGCRRAQIPQPAGRVASVDDATPGPR